MPERMTFHLYLDTGAVIDFQAADLTRRTNSVTGKLVEVEWTDSVGNVPRYIDIERIVAITREVTDA
jgi:hypothetical protein